MTKLYLIPAPLGDEFPFILPEYAVEIVRHLEVFICEKAKTARTFLKTLALAKPLQELTWHELDKHKSSLDNGNDFLREALAKGVSIGLISEAGCPGVADPGAAVVAEAHRLGIQVVPLVGPSALLLALMASGMNGQQFAFHGYLPASPQGRKDAFKRLVQDSQRHNQTQIFIETPYRNNQLLADAVANLPNDVRLAVACDITLPTEFIMSQSVAAWRKRAALPDLDKRPTVFLIGA